MKRIAFTITDSGVDGREPTRVVRAFWDEAARDQAFEADKNKAYHGKGEQIVNVEETHKAALAKLDGVDKLVLGLDKAGEVTLRGQS